MNITKIIRNFFSPSIIKEMQTDNYPDYPETESDRYFAKFMEEKDNQAIISFLKNGYVLNNKQRNKFAQLFVTSLSKITTVQDNLFYDTKRSLSFNLSKIESISLIEAFRNESLAQPILCRIFSPQNIDNIEKLIAAHAFNNNPLVTHILNDNKESFANAVIKRQNGIYNHDIEIIKNQLKDENFLNQVLEEHFKEKIKVLESKIHLLETKDEKSDVIKNLSLYTKKNNIFFGNLHKYYTDEEFKIVLNSTDPKKNSAYCRPQELAEYPIEFSPHMMTFTTDDFIKVFITLLARELQKNKNPELLANIALKEKCPSLFALINNLSHQLDNVPKLQPTKEDIKTLLDISKNKNQSNSDSYALKHSYQSFHNALKPIYTEISENIPQEPKPEELKQDNMKYLLEQMKKDMASRRIQGGIVTNNSSYDEIVLNSQLPEELKSNLLKSLRVSEQLLKLDVNQEEKNFCERVPKLIFNIVQIYSDLESPNHELTINLSEQYSTISDTLNSISSDINKRNLDNINSQVQELVEHQKRKRYITK